MKRKGGGHKKGKSKKAKTAPVKEEPKHVSSGNVEENSGTDDPGNDEQDSGMEVNTPSSSGTDQPSKDTANINPDGSIERTSAKPMPRVKVKLKTSKALESQGTSSDAPSQSDTEKSSQKMDVDKQAIVAEKMEDSISSLLEMKVGPSENPAKKSGSIKIKTSKPLASLGAQAADVVVLEGDNEHQKELKDTPQASRSSKQELESALTIIKKVMKMDAAEPFNAPVDPIALGIPDYFDVIDTPMDFGTICSNIEKGGKYSNSEDVFKDVQYIWGNCYKYNNKGDYILDLMRRVKKNFMKYWAGAGLYTGNDGNQADSGKGGSKNKAKKRHGMRRHKNDCLCAICVLKRKRKEREERERIARGLTIEEFKQETSHVGSPYGGEEGEGSSNSDDSDDEDAEGNLEEKGVKLEISPGKRNDANGEGGSEMETGKNHQGQIPDKNTLDGEPQQVKENESSVGFQENDGKPNAVAADQQKLMEAPEKKQQRRSHLYGNFRSDNPALMSLCGILFPENPSFSVWSGPHSLVPRKLPTQSRSSIHAAIESFMN